MNRTSHEPIFDALNSITPLALTGIMIGFIIIVLVVAFYIRWWFVQTSIFEMQKDLAEIKSQLLNEEKIASYPKVGGSKEIKPHGEKFHISLRPRRAFFFISLAVPILLMILLFIININ